MVKTSILSNVPLVAEVTEGYLCSQFGRGQYSNRAGYILLHANRAENQYKSLTKYIDFT